ncbi:MAG: DoxX family protein [Nanoarchaeota archaeon]
MKKAMNIVLWILQVLLAALFGFSGVMKFFMTAEQLASLPFPLWFFWFIGIAEVAGALGLLLPGMFKVHQHLTRWAAIGLAIIMAGAVVTTLWLGMGVASVFPGVIGVLCVIVAKARK